MFVNNKSSKLVVKYIVVVYFLLRHRYGVLKRVNVALVV